MESSTAYGYKFESFYTKADCIFLVGVRQRDRDSLMETGIRVDQEHSVP
jgi:hypothetical protein